MKHYKQLAALALAGALAGAAAPAAAQDAVEQGRVLATSGSGAVLACATCHGAQGEGMAAANFPYLAGQGAAYLALQIQDFASGKRQNPVMAPIAKAMSPAQVQAAAAYYASLPAPFDAVALSDHLDTYPAASGKGAWLANRGDWENNIPACIQCHGPGGVGVGEHFPALAGQSAAYLKEQLTAWKQRKRDPGPLALMGAIAARMSDQQIDEASDYFSSLPQRVKAAAPSAQGAK